MNNISNKWLSKDRLIALIDAIFGFAMTLLVITIDIPNIKNVFSNQDLANALKDLLPSILIYILSFILLANLWILNHKYFSKIKRINNSFAWLNIYCLLFVVLFPFTTDLVGEYGQYPIANIVFHANNLAIGIFYMLIIIYAIKNGLTSSKDEMKKNIYIDFNTIKRTLIFPAVATLALISSYFLTSYSNLLYLLIPLMKLIIDKKDASNT